MQPLRDRRVGDGARVAWLLIGAVAVFLLIACVNVVNLTLARVAERQREFAIRAAVGAGKVRLAGLAFAESMLLALDGGRRRARSLAFALLRTFVAMAPAGVPGIAEASIDTRVFVVAVVLIALTGLAIGVWPAVSVFRAGGWQGLRSTGASSPGARPRVRFALVTTQIALTLALLGGSALLLRSLWNVVTIPLGFEAERVVTLSVGLSATRYPAAAHGRRVLRGAARPRRRDAWRRRRGLEQRAGAARRVPGRRRSEVEERPARSRRAAPRPDPRPRGHTTVLRDVAHPADQGAGVRGQPIAMASPWPCSRSRPGESCLPGNRRWDGAFGS